MFICISNLFGFLHELHHQFELPLRLLLLLHRLSDLMIDFARPLELPLNLLVAMIIHEIKELLLPLFLLILHIMGDSMVFNLFSDILYMSLEALIKLVLLLGPDIKCGDSLAILGDSSRLDVLDLYIKDFVKLVSFQLSDSRLVLLVELGCVPLVVQIFKELHI